MNVVIVYSHPYDKSFCHAILESTKKALLKAGHKIDIINLDKDNFNPVMTGEDLLAFRNKQVVDEQSKNYIERIQKAEHLIFIFPIWWELMPAIMKGFIDKIIFPGSVYEYTLSGYGMKSLLPKLQSIKVITTMNTPFFMYKFIYGDAIKKSLIRGTFKKIGFRNVKWISFNMIKNSSEIKRKKWLEKVERVISKL